MRRLVLTYGLLIATLFMFACKEEALVFAGTDSPRRRRGE